MKKPVSLLLGAVLWLTLAACTPSVAGSPTPGPEATPTPTPAPTSTPPADSTPAPAASAGPDDLSGYGPLIPFPGARNDLSDGVSFRYGLVSLTGEVAAQPIYTTAYYAVPASEDSPGVLLLEKALPDGTFRCALCAGDGSWCTPFDYTHDWEMFYSQDTQAAYPMVRDGNILVYLDTRTGEELLSLASPFDPDDERNWDLFSYARPQEDCSIFWHWQDDLYQIYHWSTGRLVTLPEDISFLSGFSQGLALAGTWVYDQAGNYLYSRYGYLDASGAWAIPKVYENATDFKDGHALVCTTDGVWQVIDSSGAILLSLPQGYRSEWEGDRCMVFSRDEDFLLLTDDLQLLELPPNASPVQPTEGWVAWQEGESRWTLLRLPDQRWSMTAAPWEVSWPYALCRPGDEGGAWSLFDLERKTRRVLPFEGDAWYYFESDSITGEPILFCYCLDPEYSCALLDLEGNLLSQSAEGFPSMIGGLIGGNADGLYTLTAPDGTEVFRWTIQTIP